MIISIVGAGGKTTKMYALKDQYVKEGKSVLMTTSTHMLIEEHTLVNQSVDVIKSHIEQFGWAHAGCLLDHKLGPLDQKDLDTLKQYVDVVLIEADGSNHFPLKCLRSHEPMIDQDSDEVLLIMNVSGLGKKVKDVVHHYEVMGWQENDIVDAKMIQEMIDAYPKHCKICIQGADSIYKRVLKALLESRIDVSCVDASWFLAQPKLVLFGAGHVSRYVAKISKMLGMYTIVVDPRSEFANREYFQDVDEIHCVEFHDYICPKEKNCCYVVVTRGHKDDANCLKMALKQDSLYVGMIGSKKKVYATFETLNSEGYDTSCVHAPIGLDISANTPQEIAVSIMAEIIQIKNRSNISSMDEALYHSSLSGVLCIILEKHGSAPRGVGSMMLVHENGIISTIGGGSIEHQVILDAKNYQNVNTKWYYLNNEQGASLGMICGGSQKILFVHI